MNFQNYYILSTMRYLFGFLFCFSCIYTHAQSPADRWADSVYKQLTPEERIAQLMIVRLSTIDMSTKKVTFYDKQVEELVKKYNVGGVLIFQGGPTQQALAINKLQKMAKTPIMFSIDGEWGVGQRLFDSVQALPKQMMLGAVSDPAIIYAYGKAVAEQCKRLGIHVNFAPVVDVNNNAANPVINDRSFGENKHTVAAYGIEYMKGMQDNGVLACAKHFPGHGDVTVDSHYDLPVIKKPFAALDTLELFPFKKIFEAGVGSVMIAHLNIPAIDNATNRATSLSSKNVKELLRNTLGYQGLTFTDALEMKGVQKFFPGGEAAVQSLIAGNDVLCLPLDVPSTIQSVQKAIREKKLTWDDIENHCKKILRAKYHYVLHNVQPVQIENLAVDLNRDVPALRQRVAENAITLLSASESSFFPLNVRQRVAYVGFGIDGPNAFARRMEKDYNANCFYFSLNPKNEKENTEKLLELKRNYDYVIIGVHNTTRSATTNYGIAPGVHSLIQKISTQQKAVVFHFGNAYAAQKWCALDNLVIAYEDDSIVHEVAADMLNGKKPYLGKLPVTLCSRFPHGSSASASIEKKNSTR
ncbi:MAG: hypothetical protein KF880_04475 [Ferruginibacter sp.]|nr:hypothetical protein [Ferruginibacter sp.]